MTSAMYIENIAFIVTIEPDTEVCETRVHGMPSDPFIVGMVLVDVAKTYAKCFQLDDDASTIEEYLKRIKEGFEAEWDKPTTEIEVREEILGGEAKTEDP